MATCSNRGLNEATFINGYSRAPYESPLSSTMGSVSSLLNDSGYRGGVGGHHYHNDTINRSEKDGHVYEDLEVGPPPITPVSGKLERHKEKRLIKPIAVRPITPTGVSTKRGPATPDNIAGLPRVPDVVSGAQYPRDHFHPGGTHYAPARSHPIKAQSLQDIKFVNSGKRSSISSINQLTDLKPSLKRAPISQSLNQLNFNYNHLNSNLNVSRVLDYRRVSRSSQSSYNSDCRQPPVLSMQDSRRHSNVSVTSSQAAEYRTLNQYEDNSSHVSSHLSSGVVMEEDEMENIYELKQKIQEQESQITLLRQTMEQNEQIIFKVYEEKQQVWEEEMEDVREDLKEAEDKMYKMEQSLRRQIYQLETKKKELLLELDKVKQEKDQLDRKVGTLNDERSSYENQVEDANWQICQKSGEISLLKSQLKETKEELSHKTNELVGLKSHVKDIQLVVEDRENQVKVMKVRLSDKDSELSEKGAEMNTIEKRILQESRREMSTISSEIEHLKLKLCQKENELSAEKFEVLQLQEMKEELERKLGKMEKDLIALREAATLKDNELAQEKCEVLYLREVHEKLSQQIADKNDDIVNLQSRLKQVGENHLEVTAIKEKLIQRERDVAACEEKLGQIESEKDGEISTLHRRLSQKECEISAIQAKLNQVERERAVLQAKVARLKDNNNVGHQKHSEQKQLEQDFTRLQVEVTKQERLLLEQNSEITLVKQQHEIDIKRLKSQFSKQEKDSMMWKEKAMQREGEIRNVREKLNSRENDAAIMRGKLAQHEGHEICVQSQNIALKKEIADLKEKMQTLKSENISLEVKVGKGRSENHILQGKFDKVTNEVRGLKNQLDTTLRNELISQSDDAKEQKSSAVIDSCQAEILRLKTELKEAKDKIDEQQTTFEREQAVWQEEKQKVIRYQKQLQLNYIHMFRKNKNLEKDIQNLTVEQQRRSMNGVVDHV
ncbi:uncharacterized protein LOC144446152 [Glandiceps talaboti]